MECDENHSRGPFENVGGLNIYTITESARRFTVHGTTAIRRGMDLMTDFLRPGAPGYMPVNEANVTFAMADGATAGAAVHRAPMHRSVMHQGA